MPIADGIRSSAPNTQPIYPRTPLTWVAKLTNQATALEPQITGNPPIVAPVILGVASDSGAILEHVAVMSVKWDPNVGGSGGSGGGGGSGSWNAADGTVGLRTLGDPQRLRFYTRKQGGELFMANEFALNAENPYQILPWGLPILPSGQNAWRLEPAEELYVGLRYPAPGLIVWVRGGHYE